LTVSGGFLGAVTKWASERTRIDEGGIVVGLDIWDWSMLLGGSLLVCFAALLV
jgi:hypothetical protein